MAAAAEARKRTVTEAAIAALLAEPTQWFQGDRLFAAAWGESWTRTVMQRLVTAGAVSLQRHGRSNLYRATDGLDRYRDEEELTSLLWPGSRLPDPGALAAAPRGESDAETEPHDADPSRDELLRAVLQVAHATLENVAYLRQKVDRVEQDVQRLLRLWEPS